MILVIGASSYVGARIFYDLSFDLSVIGTYHRNKLSNKFIELDITDQTSVSQIIQELKPTTIIHVANEANPRWCEANPEEAIKVNETATKNIINACGNVKLIYISSTVASNPFNIYAKTKFNSEQLIKNNCKNWNIIRPSLVIGMSPNMTNDRMMNRLLKNLDSGVPAIYDTSWKFKPTDIEHLSIVIKNLITSEINNETIDVVLEKEVSRYTLANDILTPFSIPLEEINNNDRTPTLKESINDLVRLNLPLRNYSETISRTINEIKNRSNFVI